MQTPAELPEGIRHRETFVMTLAQALHQFGTPAHRLEHAMEAVARDLDMQIQILATPTSVTLAIGTLDNQRTFLMRVEPSSINLAKLADVHTVMQQVSGGTMNPQQGKQAIDAIVSRRSRYPRWVHVIAFALTSACATLLFGGHLVDAAFAAAIGLLVGTFTVLSSGNLRYATLVPAVGAAMAAILARTAAYYLPDLHPLIITLAALIVLLPGLSLTMGVHELAHQHLVSGTARLMGAFVVLLQLGLGVAAGWGLANYLWGPSTTLAIQSPDLVLVVTAVVGAAIAFTVLFNAAPRDFISVLSGAALAYTAARWGTAQFGPEFGAAFGAWSMGCLANVLARIRNKPALITILPGIILLVPGSMGFLSVQAIMSDEIGAGMQTGATTIMVAIALVVGLFLSNFTVSPRKFL